MVGSTRPIERLIDRFAPSGAEFRVRVVTRSDRSLRASQKLVEEDLGTWAARGIDIAGVGVDAEANALRIEVADLSPAHESALKDAYGDEVIVRPGTLLTPLACVSRNSCAAPLKGGLRITSSTGYQCTSAILGNTSPSATVMITAGHCGRNGGGVNKNWFHNGVNIGPMVGYVYPGNGGTAEADVAVINVVENGARNKVYGMTFEEILSVNGENGLQGGGTIQCRSGATSGWKCAAVNGTDLTRTYTDGATIKHLWRIATPSQGGDSGG